MVMSVSMRRVRWLPPLLFALLILGVSSIPAKQMPEAEAIWRMDKLIHAAEYLVFAFLTASALGARPLWRLALAAGLCALFGVCDELYQSTVPGRDSSHFDMIADATGACFGAALWGVVYLRRSN